MAEKKDIWDKFEYKAVVCFTGYRDRYDLLRKELDRVGLTDVQPHWDFPNPYHQLLLKTVPMTKFCASRNCFNIGLNNYRAIATAYHLGCRNCLIMEDDIRFLKDIKEIEKSLNALPEDFDLALLDHNKPCSLPENEYLGIFNNRDDARWYKFKNLRSTGCYAMSRICMARYLSLFEAPANKQGVLRNPDGFFREEYLGSDMNLYVANPPLALQKTFATAHISDKRMEEYYSLHARIEAPADIFNI